MKGFTKLINMIVPKQIITVSLKQQIVANKIKKEKLDLIKRTK
jgi:hypothetical protein